MTVPPSHAAAGEAGADPFPGWVAATTGPSGYRTDLAIAGFDLVADEPLSVGGSGAGPTPYEFMLAALASCTAMTLRMYADRKAWPLERVTVRLRDTPKHLSDCMECENSAVGPRSLDRAIDLDGPLTPEQRTRLLQIADRCPVKQTLTRGIEIRTVE